MMAWLRLLAVICLVGLTPAARAADLAPVDPVIDCAALADANISTTEAPTSISDASVQEVNGHQMCVVTGYISPQIRFQVNLPVTGWTQRYLQTGCGGLCGRLGIESPQRDCAPEAAGQMVIASTDMGHEANDGIWGASDMQLRVDFGYRGVHETAGVAKRLIAAYYGQAPAYSYFSGCSDGGREALMEAQRYPETFDGIAAGAAALNFMVQNSMYHGWNAHVVQPDSTPRLTEADLPVLHAGALAACDMADGVGDGIISDPSCRFDPRDLVCAAGQGGDCLSADAAEAAAALYRGPYDGDVALLVGSVLPGSELNWAGVSVPSAKFPGGLRAQRGADQPQGMDQMVVAGQPRAMSPSVAAQMLQSLAYTTPFDPEWTLEDFRFTIQSLDALRPMRAIFDATNPDLTGFADAGGKLLIWHGLADPHISPLNSVAYWQAVQDYMDDPDQMMRLFLLPGMSHCGGGDLTSVDVMTPLMAWVEDGIAPASLVLSVDDAAAEAGQGRRIFAYPASSVLEDGGDADRPDDWHAGEPVGLSETLWRDWAGGDFFAPGYQRSCGFEGFDFVCRAE
ncbi:MAG: tannase/feruloyl esterase family alpha/beta hydrolase [Paracoccus sp. (in: a-proteobacteria)]|nr:tannase/feruloyl esterase family alpha/beta hydrolase [Paracoccus sp. (in: a-proteobacteria)]